MIKISKEEQQAIIHWYNPNNLGYSEEIYKSLTEKGLVYEYIIRGITNYGLSELGDIVYEKISEDNKINNITVNLLLE